MNYKSDFTVNLVSDVYTESGFKEKKTWKKNRNQQKSTVKFDLDNLRAVSTCVQKTEYETNAEISKEELSAKNKTLNYKVYSEVKDGILYKAYINDKKYNVLDRLESVPLIYDISAGIYNHNYYGLFGPKSQSDNPDCTLYMNGNVFTVVFKTYTTNKTSQIVFSENELSMKVYQELQLDDQKEKDGYEIVMKKTKVSIDAFDYSGFEKANN